VAASSLSFPSDLSLQVGFFDSLFNTGSYSAHYSVQVFTDPGNVYCAGCLDFVYHVASVTSGQVGDFSVGNFGGFNTSVGFSGNGPAPTSISRSIDGNLVDFIFGTPFGGGTSAALVIQTNATGFQFAAGQGSLTGVPALVPTPTPEPGTLMLLGTGLAGLAGAIKRKIAS
jgi:hypothetical protein